MERAQSINEEPLNTEKQLICNYPKTHGVTIRELNKYGEAEEDYESS